MKKNQSKYNGKRNKNVKNATKNKKKGIILITIVIMIIAAVTIFNNNGGTEKVQYAMKQQERAKTVEKIINNGMMEEEEISDDNCEYTINVSDSASDNKNNDSSNNSDNANSNNNENSNIDSDSEVSSNSNENSSKASNVDSITLDYYKGTKDSIVIPKEIDGKKVENIDRLAFKENKDVQTIKVPKEIAKNVEEIENFEVNEKLSNNDYTVYTTKNEYSEAYLKYIELSEEEKKKVEAIPATFDVPIDEVYSTEMKSLYGVGETASSSLPQKFDLRDQIKVGVENQNQFGICYAYATLSSLETNLALRKNELKDFSDVHAATLSCGYGGQFEMVDNQYFKKTLGPVSEDKWSRENAEKTKALNRYLCGGGETSALTNIKKQMKNDKAEYSVLNTIYMPSITGKMKKNDKYTQKVADTRQAIKEHIMNYGSLYAGVCTDYESFRKYEGKQIACANEATTQTHAISIIGWDDKFSKNNFPSDMNVTQDGAYLALNSWGDDWGDSGCFWISYQDYYLESNMCGVITAIKSDEKITLSPGMFNIFENYQYTGKPIEVKKNRISFTYDGVTKNMGETEFNIIGYKNNIEEGIGYVLIQGTGNFIGTVEVPFNIGDYKEIQADVIEYEGFYDGEDHSITIDVKEPSNAEVKYYSDSSYSREISKPSFSEPGYYVDEVYYKIFADGYNTKVGKSYVWVKYRDLCDFDVSLSQDEYIYDGTEKKPEVILKMGDYQVTSTNGQLVDMDHGINLNIEYKNNIEIGMAKVIITTDGTQYLGGKIEKTFVIKENANEQTKKIKYTATGYLADWDYKYHGIKVVVDPSVPNPTIMYGTKEGEYDLTESPKTKNHGFIVYFKISADGYETAYGSATVSIYTRNSDGLRKIIQISMNKKDYIYTGNPIIPDITVKLGKDIIDFGDKANIFMRYVNNTSVGKAYVDSIEIKDAYCVCKHDENSYDFNYDSAFTYVVDNPEDMEFNIIGGIDIEVEGYVGEYDRLEHTITTKNIGSGVSVKYGLKEGEYTLNQPPKFSDVGKHTVYYKASLSGYDDIMGSAQVVIQKSSINDMDITLDKSEYIYDGTAKTPKVTIEDSNGNVLRENEDFECTYQNNIEVGIATVTVKGINNYTGTRDLVFMIYSNEGSNEILARGYTGEYDRTLHGVYVDIFDLGDGANVKYGKEQGNYTEIRSPQYADVGNYSVYYQVTQPGKENVEGTAQVKITPKNIQDLYVDLSEKEYKYDGNAKTPSVTVKDENGYQLKEETEYTLSYENNTQAGRGKAVIVGTGNYTGTVEKEFAITEDSFQNITATAQDYNGVYDGQAHGITINVSSPSSGTTIIYGKEKGNYTSQEPITYSNVGTHYVYYRVSASNYYDYEGSAKVVITPKSISNVEIILKQTQYAYDGEPKEALKEVKDGQMTLIAGSDYDWTYENNVEVGTAKVIITGKGNYQGSKEKEFAIINLQNIEANISDYNGVYDGQEHGININITDPINGATIVYGNEDNNYTQSAPIEYTNVGQYNVYYKISAEGYVDYKGMARVMITPKQINNVEIILNSTEYMYDGTAKEALREVKDGQTTLIAGTDYEFRYENNVEEGTAKVIITGKGNYQGTKEAEFIIKDILRVEVKNYTDKVVQGNNYVTEIKAGTKISQLKGKIETNGYIKFYDNKTNQKITNENQALKTGMKVVIRKDNTNQEKEYKIAVKGDITGDGEVSAKDLLKLSRTLVGLESELEGEYKLAANIHQGNQNPDSVDNVDLLKLSRVLVGLDTID